LTTFLLSAFLAASGLASTDLAAPITGFLIVGPLVGFVIVADEAGDAATGLCCYR
jgi:hypothetical protein